MGRLARIKRKKLVAAMIRPGVSHTQAAIEAGYNPSSVSTILNLPEVRAQIDEGISEAARAAGVSRQWVIEKLKQVVNRCLQGEPVLDREGHETGEWKFDSGGANRALELIGKHLRMFNDDSSPTAQIGAAVIRVLAQEAQAGRMINVSAEPGPISTPGQGTPLASTRLDADPAERHTQQAPLPGSQ